MVRQIKEWKCVVCGNGHPYAFYPGEKSYCKVHRVKDRIIGAADTKHHCKICETEDPEKFKERYRTICRSCMNDKQREKYKEKTSMRTSPALRIKTEKSD